MPANMPPNTLLEVRDLRVSFPARGQMIPIVDGVSFA